MEKMARDWVFTGEDAKMAIAVLSSSDCVNCRKEIFNNTDITGISNTRLISKYALTEEEFNNTVKTALEIIRRFYNLRFTK